MARLVLLSALVLAACGPDQPTGGPARPDSAGVSTVDTTGPSDAPPLDSAGGLQGASGSPPGVTASCDRRSAESMCYAFTGDGWTAQTAQTECSGSGSTYRASACPTVGRIGECTYRPDDDAARELVYTFYEPMDPVLAEGICRGVWRAF